MSLSPLDEQDSSKPTVGTTGFDRRAGKARGRNDRIMESREIFSHIEGPKTQRVSCVRLLEMTSVVPNDVPVGAKLQQVSSEEGLGEIFAAEFVYPEPC
jgi:hypothetical protein